MNVVMGIEVRVRAGRIDGQVGPNQAVVLVVLIGRDEIGEGCDAAGGIEGAGGNQLGAIPDRVVGDLGGYESGRTARNSRNEWLISPGQAIELVVRELRRIRVGVFRCCYVAICVVDQRSLVPLRISSDGQTV